MILAVQFALGLVFGLGLVVAGLSDPAKVLNFLDLAAIPTGGWDPSLALVLAAATGITYLGYRLVLRRPRPLLAAQFHLPSRTSIEAPVIVGPALFGLGWGLVGLCPGPALTALGAGHAEALIFVPAMLIGMVIARLLALRSLRAAPGAA
jgi:uncharacterized membrane protein YedE/YeeE